MLKLPRSLSLMLLIIGALLLVLFAGKRAWDYWTSRAIRHRQSAPAASARMIARRQMPGYYREELEFQSASGESVPLLGLIPDNGVARHPAIVFLYGIGMKMSIADKPKIAGAVTGAGFAFFVPEQFGRGKRRQAVSGKMAECLAVRRRIVMTIHETRALVDILARRSDVDMDRIYLWGASFGAMTGCAAMAYDSRVAAGVLTLAAGDFQMMVADTPYARTLPRYSWLKVAAPAAASLLRPFDPLHHLGRFAPRPLLMQNMLADELIPRSAVEALYRAAGEPKQIIWYPGAHDDFEQATLEKLVQDALLWLQNIARPAGQTARATLACPA